MAGDAEDVNPMQHEPFPSQREAIESPLGPALVLAGPGAGKTFCLIRRVEHLIRRKGLAPDRISAVTFTNKAAEEVTARLHVQLGALADRITRGTLHALCLDVLRDHPAKVGLRRGFGVADEDYQKLLLRRLNVYPEKRRGNLLNLFGKHRLGGYELTEGDEALFDSYIELLRSKNLLDFDDIIALTDRLFRDHPEVADDTAARWDCILVDEFQDLDATQYAVIKRMAEPHGNVFAVGDDEQSIFAWRGSDPRILWRFQNEFGLAEPIVLDRNWRCSRQIFSVARRLLRENPVLFRKSIEAERDSEFEVEAYAFRDEDEEAAWILEHLLSDRQGSGLGWGSYAILYRKHDVGHHLEKRFLAAGVPCRLARGRALLDDRVIAYVVDSLRIVNDPSDELALEGFAGRLIKNIVPEVRILAESQNVDFLSGLRAFARRGPADHPDTKKAWRFIYHVENLRALHESHDSLAGLVGELLSQRVKPYENRLEERHDELEDPATFPGAPGLAERLRATAAAGGRVYIEPRGGGEIALRGLLEAVRFPCALHYLDSDSDPGTHDTVLPVAGWVRPAPTTLFKSLQLIHSRGFGDVLRDFVAFDLETTDRDPERCGIVEIGAVRVVDGKVTETFRELVRPQGPISPGASDVHGYTDDAVRNAPRLETVWPRFRAFCEGFVLVAHNGHRFDVPVLRRHAARLGGLEGMVFFDTLPLARSLFRESARLEDLAERFEVRLERAHHALDDALALAHVFLALSARKRARARKAALVNLLDQLAIGLALEDRVAMADEDRLLLESAVPYALGRYSDALERYEAERKRARPEALDVEEVIGRLGGRRAMERIRAERSPAERYPLAMSRLQALIDVSESDTLEEGVRRLLERVALSTSEGVEADPHRVNLLTLHSTKGLEFSRVYVVGVEDYQIPGYYAVVDNVRAEIEEARRLLYVGMTRARDRLVLTRADGRGGRESGGSLFLEEIGLSPVRA